MLSLILPIHNEEGNLKKNFDLIYKETKKLGNFEIILAEDGSTDNSPTICREKSKMLHVRLMTSNHRLGKGKAIKEAITLAKGNIIGCLDIDMAVPARYLNKAVTLVDNGEVFVTGSRYIKGSDANRSILRLFASLSYNWLIALLFQSKVKDHQCGFKFWSSRFIKTYIKKVKDDHWFFDTELIIMAQRDGIKVREFPISWDEQPQSNVHISDVIYFINAALRLRLRMKND
jgi:hypothetical protein